MSRVEKSIDVAQPITKVYNQWTQFEDFPTFMGGVDEVEQLDARRLRWTTTVAGVTRTFDAEIIEQKPDEQIAWRTEDGEDHTGAVTFEEIDPHTTRVNVVMSFRPENWVEKVGDALNVLDRRVGFGLDLERRCLEVEQRRVGLSVPAVVDGVGVPAAAEMADGSFATSFDRVVVVEKQRGFVDVAWFDGRVRIFPPPRRDWKPLPVLEFVQPPAVGVAAHRLAAAVDEAERDLRRGRHRLDVGLEVRFRRRRRLVEPRELVLVW